MTEGPLCVFCGAEFPVELERCPTCSRPWIDQRLSEVADGATVSLGDVGTSSSPDIDTEPSRRIPLWMIAGGVALVALTVYGVVFSLLLNDPDPDAAAAGTTQTTTTTTVTPTTAPTTTTPPTTTTTTTTTTTPPTTTTTTTTIPPIDPVGSPIADATLGAFSLGPIQVGSNGANALGRLVATYGQPDEIVSLAGGEAGLCEEDTGRAVRWGWLTALLVATDDGADRFVGYLYGSGPAGHATEGLTTLSGAAVGDTVAEVDAIYISSIVEVIDLDGSPHFLLRRSSDRRTLLWGPLSGSGDEALVEGIHAPYWCDDGPFAP